MLKSMKCQGLLVLALGGLLGYAVAAGKVSSLLGADEGKTGASPGAEQVADTPGSPSATTTISGKQLPAPDPKFGGVINDTTAGSKPYWARAWSRPRAHPTSCSL